MKRDNINYLLVGVATLAAFGLLLATLFAITGRGGATTGYHAYFNNVTGLRFGAPVLYQGFRIGQVQDIIPDRSQGMRYRVELVVRKDWQIPSDSIAQLQASGLLADVRIAIQGGESTAMLPPGAEVTGVVGGDVLPP